MRALVGGAVFGLGIAGIAYFWGGEQAEEMQQEIASRAAQVAQTSVHGVVTEVSGRDITVRGDADGPQEQAALLEKLNNIEGRRVVRDELNVLPVQSPYVFSSTTQSAVDGVMPTQAVRAQLADAHGPKIAGLDIAAGVPDQNWPTAVDTGYAAMEQLQEGQFTLEDRMLTVTGSVILEQDAEDISRILGQLPEGYDSQVNVQILDDGKPFELSLVKEGADVQALSGKLPADFSQTLFADIPRGYLPDADGAFGQNLTAVMNTFDTVDGIRATVRADKIEMSGRVDVPATAEAVATQMAEAAATGDIELSLSVLDDGTPPKLSMIFDALEGTSVSGKLPPMFKEWLASKSDLSITDIDNALIEGITGSAEAMKNQLSKLPPWMPEFEKFKADVTETDISLEGVVSPGVDAEQMQAEMRDALGTQAIALSPLPQDALPATGTTRIHMADNTEQVFDTVWLPSMNFEVSLDTCQSLSDQVLRDNRINFVTGSSRLDARSVRAVNALTSIFKHCLKAGSFTVELGGHTDSQGDLAANNRLSLSRASAVLNALQERGVAAAALVAKGYGPSQPIADNGTAEGRAANRRTTILWTVVEETPSAEQTTDQTTTTTQGETN